MRWKRETERTRALLETGNDLVIFPSSERPRHSFLTYLPVSLPHTLFSCSHELALSFLSPLFVLSSSLPFPPTP